MANDPTTQDLLDAISGLANTPTTSTQIGVPKGYVPHLPSQWSDNTSTSVGTPMPQTPFVQTKTGANGQPFQTTGYQEGDQYTPATYGSTDIANIQKQMAALGLIAKGSVFQLGIWDPTSANAYKQLLGYANQQGISDVQALGLLSKTGGFSTVDANGNVIRGGAGAKTPLTSSEQINALVQAVAPSVIGRSAPQAVVDAITTHLHGLQNGAATAGSTADSPEAAPSANSVWFQEQLKELLPNMYKENNLFQGLAQTQKLIGGKTSPLGSLVTQ